MKKGLTELVTVLDRSGSMASIKDDMEGGLWTLVTEQHGVPGECQMSLYQFDDVWEPVFEGKPSGDVQRSDCALVPRGSTALNDAVVKSLSNLESRILSTPEDARPEHVIICVITDGCENASRENTKADAQKAIHRATEKFGWKFLFLAADEKGFEEGRGLMKGTSARGLVYDKQDIGGVSQRYSAAVTSMRGGGSFDIGEGNK